MGTRYNTLTGDLVCSDCNIKAGNGLRCWVCGAPYVTPKHNVLRGGPHDGKWVKRSEGMIGLPLGSMVEKPKSATTYVMSSPREYEEKDGKLAIVFHYQE